MANVVEYVINLRDMLSAKIKEAEKNVGEFEKKMSEAGEKAKGIGGKLKEGLGMIGVGFAAFKGLELIHEGVEAVHKLHEAEAQVKAGLESTGHAAGLSYENLEEMAKNFSSKFKYSRAELTDMQSVLLTFPSVTKETFGSASQAIMDMSTRMGGDLKGATVQVGKALQDPILGISALKRVGVNFTESQKDVIKKLVETGDTAKAQTLILNELNTEFGGSAAAAAAADPLFKYNKAMASMKMAVGETAIELQGVLAPALEWLGGLVKDAADGLKSAFAWLKENKDTVSAFAITVGILTAAYGVYWAMTNTAAIYTSILTAKQWLLNIAMDANPIGAVILILGAFVAAIVYAWEKIVGFRAVITGVWGVIKEFGSIVTDVYGGIWKTIHGVFTFNKDEVAQGFAQTTSAMKDAGTRMATAYKEGYDGVMADYAKKQAEDKAKEKDKEKDKDLKPKTVGAAAAKKDTSPKGASGTKSVTINISIGKLIETFKVQTTNMGEGAGKIKEKVAETLLGAINDSQIVAGI